MPDGASGKTSTTGLEADARNLGAVLCRCGSGQVCLIAYAPGDYHASSTGTHKDESSVIGYKRHRNPQDDSSALSYGRRR